MKKNTAILINERGEINFDELSLSPVMSENVELIKNLFEGDAMLRTRECKNAFNPEIHCTLFFMDGMANSELVDGSIAKPLVEMIAPPFEAENTADFIAEKVLYAGEVKKSGDVSLIAKSLSYGDTVVFAEGASEALIVNSKGWATRGVEQPENEKNLRGPKEGFTESLLMNTGLIRRKLKTPDLKFEMMSIGTRSNTGVCICYLKSLASDEVLKTLKERMKKIEIDGILDTNYIDELTRDNPYTPFKTAGVTERPDVVAANLLEGKIAVIVDGSPSVMTVPYLLIESLQSDDDYYLNYYFASIGRLLRIISLLITTITPAFYIALVAFHKEMIPKNLALSISAAREGVPFPITVECIIMLTVFEILRESGVRMPSNVGAALSIVGAIVIGQAAVDAKFVSAPMVIIVSMTGITGLMVSKLKGVVILYRLLLVILASVLGMYGLIFGLMFMVAHAASLTSYGVRYTSFISGKKIQEIKDIYLRLPWQIMKTRPVNIAKNLVRKN